MKICIRRSLALVALAGSALLAEPIAAQQIGFGNDCANASGPAVTSAADRATVKVGEAVTVTASVNAPAGEPIAYMWRAENGRVFGSGPTVRFDTTSLAPGRYEVSVMTRGRVCGVSRSTTTIEVAGCPTLTLAADKASIAAGESVLLTVGGYAGAANFQWSATGGEIEQTGATARLETAGLSSGTVTVRVRASDPDCTADEQVTITVAKPETIPPSLLYFNPNDSRLDNADKAQLDDVALRAGQEITSRIVITGSSRAGERSGVARRRAERTRDYLVNEKGIDPSRVEVRANEGTGAQASVQLDITPSGA
jgi:outer membrane protein OmpA-like peptidoglycan-associated protein